jgi:Zn-dependent protease
MLVVALIISISIHEFAHAFMADKLGDNTPRLLGRVTLDPRAHLDPLGTILLLTAGFGWGRPVPFNPINMDNPKRDSALVALAGPFSNFILATILSGLLYFTGHNSFLGSFLYLTIFYNVVLGVFNLLPIHPLDGFKVVAGVLPPGLYMQWMQIRPYGIYILIFMILLNVTDVVVMPIINFITTLLGL